MLFMGHNCVKYLTQFHLRQDLERDSTGSTPLDGGCRLLLDDSMLEFPPRLYLHDLVVTVRINDVKVGIIPTNLISPNIRDILYDRLFIRPVDDRGVGVEM